MKTKKLIVRAIWTIFQWGFIAAVIVKLVFMAVNLIKTSGGEIFKF